MEINKELKQGLKETSGTIKELKKKYKLGKRSRDAVAIQQFIRKETGKFIPLHYEGTSRKTDFYRLLSAYMQKHYYEGRIQQEIATTASK